MVLAILVCGRVLFLYACVHCVSGYDFIDLMLHVVAKKVHSSLYEVDSLILEWFRTVSCYHRPEATHWSITHRHGLVDGNN